jgi:hypothetical protein
MNSTNLIKKLGILGISMGLMASPLAFSQEQTLPIIIITPEELVSPSMRSDPINDPRDLTQPAFPGHVNGIIEPFSLSPSFRSEPVSDLRDRTQPAFREHLITIPVMEVSPSFRSDPIKDPFLKNSDN